VKVYGGQPEWGRNLEAAQLLGAELERAAAERLQEAADAESADGLTPINRNGLGGGIS
jgi:hypothetical protein